MNFALSDEQTFLQEAARGTLSRHDTMQAARAAADDEPLPDLWPVAIEAGWTGLLIDEKHGGAGLGFFDAMLVLEECGRTLAATGILGHLLATSLLQAAGDERLPRLAAGDIRAAYAPARPPVVGRPWQVDRTGGLERLGVPPSFAKGRLTGEIGFVPDLPGADVIVAAALDDSGAPVAVRIDLDGPGVTIDEAVCFDRTRPLGHLRLSAAYGERLDVSRRDLARAWYLAQALLAAEALGAAQTALDMGVAYAMERHAFGRPIGSYQAVKHQLVEILRLIDRTRSLLFYAGYAAEGAGEELALAASSARLAGEEAVNYGSRTNIAVHGGIGVTWEHDGPWLYRRAQLSRLLLGGDSDCADRVAEEIIAKARREGVEQPDILGGVAA